MTRISPSRRDRRRVCCPHCVIERMNHGLMIGIEAAERKALAEQAKQKGPLVSLHCLSRVASASFCRALFRCAWQGHS
jgi:hypothetical protein